MVTLRVLEPCRESWDAMSGSSRVRHCESCDKDVHDLRGMSHAEAVTYVRARSGASLCVRMLVVTAAVAACGAPPAPAVSPTPVGHTDAPAVAMNGDSDRDRDGIPDADDQCPDDAEDRDGVDDGDGCPEVDADKDGIADTVDACPKEPGVASPDPHKNGCPRLVMVEAMGDLVVLQQVHFARGASKLLADSFPMIDETVAVMQRMPAIHRIEIGGHASPDEAGAQRLSEARAKAVMARMAAAGVDAKRLVVRGYGASRPIDDNKTSDGRQTNRRVEFRVVEDVPASTAQGASCAPPPAAAGRP